MKLPQYREIKEIVFNGKNPKLPYYILNYFRFYMLPDAVMRLALKQQLQKAALRNDFDYIMQRVDYYNKLNAPTPLGDSVPDIVTFKRKWKKNVYFFDTVEIVRYFAPKLKFIPLFGDITYTPKHPSIVKSRPILGNNTNSVILKLDKIRHFIYVVDNIPFAQKLNKAIFRGKVLGAGGAGETKECRSLFFDKFDNNPRFDLGEVMCRGEAYKPNLVKPKITVYDHLKYQFVMALEGNDVASNLKWVMSSNSLAVMPKPTYETWFMEGQLIPAYHYVEVAPDYSDVEEKLNYYHNHPDKAQAIIRNANAYVSQFKDKRRELIISLLVMDRYFKLTS